MHRAMARIVLTISPCLVSSAALGQVSQPSTQPHSGLLIVRGGVLFDGTGAEPRPNRAIVARDGRIIRVGEPPESAEKAEIIEAGDLAILPGLIDLHVHFGAPSKESEGFSMPEMMRDYSDQRPQVRKNLLEAGVTTIRSVGDVTFAILMLKKQIRSGELVGPRVYTAGPLFTAPNGHPVSTIYRGNPFLIANATRQVTLPDDARAQVRRLAASGVDGIKIVYDDGGGRVPRLSFEVMQAIIQEAHGRDLWVAVHTGSDEGVRDAVRAGADTIEHGPWRSETAAILKEKNVMIVPTFAVFESSQWAGALKRFGDGAKPAIDGNLRVGAGTDCQGPTMSFGSSLHRELELLVDAGCTPQQALLAATGNAAIALRADKDLGIVGPGRWADLVLVDGRPWNRISDIRKVQLVIQDGRIVADRRPPPRPSTDQ
jgi:imidazolonepropionase-like amidohydrolase